MEKMVMMRSLYRSISRRSLGFTAAGAAVKHQDHHPRQFLGGGIRYFHHLTRSLPTSAKLAPPGICSPSATGVKTARSFSQDTSHLPAIKDAEIEYAFKDLMAASWDELPDAVIYDAKNALSKNTDDKAGQEALANVFRAAEAVEEFSAMLVSLRMAIDDSVGMSGENVKPLSDDFVNALRTAYQRYTAYLDAFGPDEEYLKKKVETELGTKMIHLKMRCSGLGSEWGK
ncbi:hypothetical protein RJ640_020272, partial [Escallonia rubra]